MTGGPASGHPPIDAVLPHAGPAILLARVVDCGEEYAECEAEADMAARYRDADGSVPAWVGIELMAQCMAAYGGLRARAHGEPPRVGLFLGSRRIDFHVPAFRPGQRLRVRAERAWGERGLVSFACSIRDAATGAILAEGRLSAVIADDPTAWARTEGA